VSAGAAVRDETDGDSTSGGAQEAAEAMPYISGQRADCNTVVA